MKPAYPDTDCTLTRMERAAPFVIDDGIDFDPLPRPTRLALDWDGESWTEYDVLGALRVRSQS